MLFLIAVSITSIIRVSVMFDCLYVPWINFQRCFDVAGALDGIHAKFMMIAMMPSGDPNNRRLPLVWLTLMVLNILLRERAYGEIIVKVHWGRFQTYMDSDNGCWTYRGIWKGITWSDEIGVLANRTRVISTLRLIFNIWTALWVMIPRQSLRPTKTGGENRQLGSIKWIFTAWNTYCLNVQFK